jgi:hypothetical protein
MSHKLNLVLHAGAAACPIDDVYAAVTPEPKDHHYPTPHGALVDLVRQHFKDTSMTIVNEQHAMTRGGLRYFGMFQIAGDNPNYDLVVGLRNTHDRSFAAGFCVGSGVFVCDNLAFSSDVVLARKHTRFIERDLPKLVARGVGQLMEHRIEQDQRIQAYQEVGLTDKDAYAAIIELLKARAIVNQDVVQIVKQWDKPTYSEFAQEQNVWRLFNAVTTVARPGLGFAVPRTQALHGVCDKLSIFRAKTAEAAKAEIIQDVEDAEVQMRLPIAA